MSLDEPAGVSAALKDSHHDRDQAVMIEGPRRRQRRVAFHVLLYSLLLTLPIVLGSYGRLDDYAQLISVQQQGARALVEWSVSFGRPLNFVVNGALFKLAGTVEGLWIARLVAAVATALAASTLALASTLGKPSMKNQVAVPALVFALPGTWVFISWGQGAGHAVSLLWAALSCLSALVAMRVMGWRKAALLAVALVLIAASMFGYQTFGLAIPALILACGLLGQQAVNALRAALMALPVTVLAFAVNVLVVRSQPTSDVTARSGLTSDWSGKAEWLVLEFLPRVLWPFSLTPRLVLASLIAVITLLFLLGSALRARKRGVLRLWTFILIIGFAVVVLPMAPFVVIVENWASSRSVLGPALAFWLLLLALVFNTVGPASADAHGFSEQARRMQSKVPLALTAALVFAALVSALRAYVGLTAPAEMEWAEVKAMWAAAPPTVSAAEVQLQPIIVSDSPFISYDEYGLATGSITWSVPAMHALAARQVLGVPLSPGQIRVTDAAGSCDSGPLVRISRDGRLLRLNPIHLWGCAVG